MKKLFFKDFTFLTHLQPNEVADVIREHVDLHIGATNMFNFGRLEGLFSGFEKPYRGEAKGKTFKMRRNIRYRNSFLPLIEGEIEDAPEGSLVSIKMKMYPFVMAFGVIWMLIVVGVLGIMGFAIYDGGLAESFMLIVPALMLIFGFAIFTIPFNIEAKIARNDIEKWLEMAE